MFRDFENLETYQNGSFEDFEDYEDLEDLESFEDFEDLEDLVDWEDYEDPELGAIAKRALKRVKKAATSAVKTAAKPKVLKKLARQAAAAAGASIAGPVGANVARKVATKVLREQEMGDFEADFESDPETDLLEMGADPEVLMEMQHIASMAAKARTKQEADQFVGALANLASSVLPSLLRESDEEVYYEGDGERDEFLPLLGALAPMAMKALPLISKGISAAGKVLTSPTARRFGRNVASRLGNTAMHAVRNIATNVQNGAPLNRNVITRGIASGVARTIGNPYMTQTPTRSRSALKARCRQMGYVRQYPPRYR